MADQMIGPSAPNLLLSQMMATSPMGGAVAGAGAEGGIGDAGFQSLLSLVNDTSLVEEQGGMMMESLKLGANGLQDIESEKLSTKANASVANLDVMQALAPLGQMGQNGMANVGLGQSANLVQETKLPVSNPMGIDPNALSGQALQMQLATGAMVRPMATPVKGPSVEATAQWAQAFADGDIKELAVGPTPDDASLMSVKSAKADASMERAIQGAKASVAGLAVMGVESRGSKESGVSDQGASGFQAFKAAELPKITTKTAPTQHSATKAVNASDFLLDQSMTSRGAVASDAKPQASALVGAKQIGQPGDHRIAPQALDFVADKVQGLRDQGGGTLRVQLAPKEMGIVELKVSVIRGQLTVKMTAESPETMKALEANKADLVAKLEHTMPTQLEISSKAVHEVSFAKSSGSVLNRPEGATTQSLLDLKGVSQSADVSDMADMMNMGGKDHSSSNQTMDFSRQDSGNRSGTNSESNLGWSREERRDRAMNQWAESFEERQSA